MYIVLSVTLGTVHFTFLLSVADWYFCLLNIKFGKIGIYKN